MEKIIKKVMIPKYVEVQSDEFDEVVLYKTNDGKEFASENLAQEHEGKLKYGVELPCVEIDEITTGYSWYKARDQDELRYIIRRLSKGYQELDEEKLKVGEWFSVIYDYDSNGPDTATFIPLSKLKEDMKKLLEQLPE